MLARAEALCKDRERLERLLDMGVELLRDALVLRETGEEKLLVDVQGAGPAPGVGRAVPAAAAAQGHGAVHRKPEPARAAGERAACGRESAHGAGELTPRQAGLRGRMSEQKRESLMTEETLDKTIKIAGVRFRENWKVYDFDATDIEVASATG